jgi:hypothetical protein
VPDMMGFTTDVNDTIADLSFQIIFDSVHVKGKAVPLHAMEALGGRGVIAPTHSRPRH